MPGGGGCTASISKKAAKGVVFKMMEVKKTGYMPSFECCRQVQGGKF
jgi:hypothetical protein